MGQSGLTKRFGLLGSFVGKYAAYSLCLSLLLLAPAFVGLFLRIRLQIGLDEGFIARNAPSRREISAQKAFFGETDHSKEWYLALFGLARSPAGNMLHSSDYDEFNAFYDYVTRRMVISGPRGNFTYAQICQPPLCELNDQIQKLMDHSWLKLLGQVEMRYPVSRVLSYDVNIGKHVFNRTTDPEGNLIGAKFIAFFFTSFIREPDREKELALFEQALVREVEAHNVRSGRRVELVAHGSNTVAREMRRGAMDAARNKLIGLCLCLSGLLIVFLFSGLLSPPQLPLRHLLLGLFSLLIPALSLLASLGLISILGLSINLLFFGSPILLLAILSTAHGSFHLVHTWNRLHTESYLKQFNASERLASTFEQVAPSFLCGHLTPILSFAISFPLLPTEHSRCWALALALFHAISFLLQVFLFSPLLALLCHHSIKNNFLASNGALTIPEFSSNEQRKDANPSISDPPIMKMNLKNGVELIPALNGGEKKSEKSLGAKRSSMRLALSRIFINPLSSLLLSPLGKSLVIFVSVLLSWLSLIKGIPSLANNMDYRQLLPRGSPAQRGFDIMDTVWMDFLQILFIVRRPPDFEDPSQFSQFMQFLSAAGSLPQALPPRAHQSWLFDYYRTQHGSDLLHHSANVGHVNMTNFGSFITGFPYRAWQSGVHYTLFEGASPSIDEMLVLMAYNGTRGLAGKRSLINQCRAVARKYPQFLISVFDTDSRTADIMDAIDPFMFRSILALLGSSLLVSLCVFCNLASAFLYTLSTFSTITNLFGLGHLLGLQLDLLTGPSAILLCSLAVQLGSHQFVGDFLACWAKQDRARRSLARSLSPMIPCVLLALLASMPPLIFSQVPFFALQARLCLVAVLLALWHCAFLLPSLALMMPQGWIS